MIGIEYISHYLPGGRVNNLNRIDELDVTESFIKKKIGMQKLAIKSAAEETSDLCCKAFGQMESKRPISRKDVDCVIVCTQNPDGRGLPHTSAILQAKLGLPTGCATFDVSLGCSGYVYCLSIVKSFMEGNGFSKGLLFTCDPYSKIINPNDKNTSLLFGDAAAVTLIGRNPEWSVGEFVFGTNGEGWDAIFVGRNGKLEMNGRAIFTFSATVIPENIMQTLRKNGVVLEDVDLFLLHQASRYIIDTLRHRLKVSNEKVPFLAADYGNTVSSSIPMLLENIDDTKHTVLISGFGVGLS